MKSASKHFVSYAESPYKPRLVEWKLRYENSGELKKNKTKQKSTKMKGKSGKSILYVTERRFRF